LQEDGLTSSRITVFAGVERLDEFAAATLRYGSGTDRLRLGHAKIMLTLTSGTPHPSPTKLVGLVSQAHQQGFPVAIHCIEEEAIASAATTLSSNRHPVLLDRIEHCAEGTTQLIDQVRRSGAMVVTQPGFLYFNGASFRRNVDERLLPHLYPAGALLRSGMPTAFGSDAPVIDPNPWPAIYSAVTRCASDGMPLAPGGNEQQAMSVLEALRAYTLGSAEAEVASTSKGSIAPGKLADMVLVDSDPLSVDHDLLPKVRTMMTIVGGSVVWERE
jgi:predicted amidohydrolase YtcJ